MVTIWLALAPVIGFGVRLPTTGGAGGAVTLTPVNFTDRFLFKCSSSGVLLWADQLGGGSLRDGGVGRNPAPDASPYIDLIGHQVNR